MNHDDSPWDQPWGGPRRHGGPRGGGRGGQRGGSWSGGPPPWVQGLINLAQSGGQPDFGRGGHFGGHYGGHRGPKVRRGDVRSAILDVLREAEAHDEQVNGYQVIQQISERSDGAWRPSPGSVYPTIQQLQDEGLIETDDGPGRKSLTLTDEGKQYVAEHADELAQVWRPFERETSDESSFSGLKPEIGQVMGAVWQLITAGSPAQQRAAIDVLVETRRKLYGILADGDVTEDDEEDEEQ